MNVIVGIIIGISNEAWLARLLVPVVWGIIWCVYLWIKGDKFSEFITRAENINQPPKWGMSHAQAFYFIEYSTAFFTSLFFSLLFGFFKDLFFNI